MHQRKRWRSKSPWAARISASIGRRKSSTNSFCSIVSERLSLHPSASLDVTTAQGCLSRRMIGIPGKFAHIQPRSRLALMSLIRRRLATMRPLKRSDQGSLSRPVSARRAGSRNSSLLSPGLKYCLVLKCPKGPTSLGLKGSKTYRYPLLWLMISESHVVPLRPLPARKTELLWSPSPRSTYRPPGSRERGVPIIVLFPARGCPSTRPRRKPGTGDRIRSPTWDSQCSSGRCYPSASTGVLGASAAPQSSLEANFTATAARIKKKSDEAGRYQCHSNAEETR